MCSGLDGFVVGVVFGTYVLCLMVYSGSFSRKDTSQGC